MNPYSRREWFERFIQPKFPTEYYIYPGQFTQEEVQTIHQGYQNWEPVLQRLTETAFKFRFMGYGTYTFNRYDAIHIVLKSPLESGTMGMAHLLGGRTSKGGDIAISQDSWFHTTDQSHLYGFRLFFSHCLEFVVAHEVGHLIGLNHSKNPEDIMYYSETMTNCSVRKPSANDERALEALYIRYLENFDFTKNFDSFDSESLVYSEE